jgi:hypothetical protein
MKTILSVIFISLLINGCCCGGSCSRNYSQSYSPPPSIPQMYVEKSASWGDIDPVTAVSENYENTKW